MVGVFFSRAWVKRTASRPDRGRAVKLWHRLTAFICRSMHILRFLFKAAIARPRLTLAVALLLLAALAGSMTYTVFLVVGVLADYLGSGRIVAGLLLGALFARLPWISRGKLRLVGLVPGALRRPLMVSMLALCCWHFLWQAEHVPAAFTGFATAFLLAYPWLRRAVFDRLRSSVFPSARGPSARQYTDDSVIEGEFREKKE